MKQFTNLYQLSKTLRFELKPIGKTKENIEKSGILERDNQRDIAYKAVKKVIDEYHKAFIEIMLNDFELQYEQLEEYFHLYHISNSEEPKKKEKLQKIQENLRKQISDKFTKSEQYKRLFGKELIKEDLSEFVNTSQFEHYIRTQKGNDLSDEQVRQIQERTLEDIDQFKDFTTYFSGFHQNRQNMYVADDKATSIAHRMIDENLPKFIDNMKTFAEIAESDVAEHFADIYSEMESYLNVNDIREMFQLDYFSMVLTQKQIDVYNAIIGGKTLADGTKIQGLNEYVNLYNQQQKKKEDRLPKLKPLFKQILSERNAISWLPEEFESDNEMLQSIEKCYQDLNTQVFGKLKTLLATLNDFDLDNIYLPNDLQLTDISQKHYGSWAVINKAIEEDLKTVNPQKKRESGEKYEERIAKLLKANDSYSIGYINSLLKSRMEKFKPLEVYFSNIGAEDDGKQQKLNHFARIENAYTEAKSLLTAEYPDDKKLSQDKNNVEKIKNLLDAIKDLQRFVKPLLGYGTESNKDSLFYGDFTPLWEQLDQITPLYNMVRNRMTQKPYSVEKIKINFDNSTLLAGWDLNKEADNTCTLLRKDGLYYLVIMDKSNSRVLKAENFISDGDCYEKMEYKQIALPMGVGAFVRKCYGTAQSYGWSCPKNCLNDEGKIIIKDDEAQPNLRCIIDCYKDFFDKYEKDGFKYKDFNFSFLESDKYEKLSEFFKEVEPQGYLIRFRNVSVDYINKLVDEGKIFLFQIYNKDFSPYSKGTPNMHTLYWKMLFDERNLADVVYKLNGEAEVFFRKKSVKVERPTQIGRAHV